MVEIFASGVFKYQKRFSSKVIVFKETVVKVTKIIPVSRLMVSAYLQSEVGKRSQVSKLNPFRFSRVFSSLFSLRYGKLNVEARKELLSNAVSILNQF